MDINQIPVGTILSDGKTRDRRSDVNVIFKLYTVFASIIRDNQGNIKITGVPVLMFGIRYRILAPVPEIPVPGICIGRKVGKLYRIRSAGVSWIGGEIR